MRKILFLSLFLSLMLVIIGLSRSIYDLWRKQYLLVSYQKQLANQKLQNQNLKQSLSKAQNPGFLEEQARNNLFLVKPGEHDVILPKNMIIVNQPEKPIEANLPNWRKWLGLFF